MTVAAATLQGTEPAPARSVHVLFVEDSPSDARLVQIHLDECGGFSVARVETLRDALSRLSAERFDVVLLDLSLPDARGATAFNAVRAAAPAVPVVVLTGLNDEATALAMVQAGAQDYLVKGNYDGPFVGRSLRYALERHRLIRAVETARRRESELKDKFLSHVSHELRSPLAVSYLYATNLLDGIIGALTAEQQEHLAVAVDALRAQMRLVDELLAAVRTDASLINIDKSVVSLPELIAATLGGFSSHPGGATVVAEAEANLPPVYADGKRIQQVLTNLVDNALKFSPPGGTVRVRAFPAVPEPGYVRIDVSDEGPGIPHGARERIFDCLFRDEESAEGQKGLGLGLYLCKLLVGRHGGRIWVESAGERGSRFSFTLPFLPSGTAGDRRE